MANNNKDSVDGLEDCANSLIDSATKLSNHLQSSSK